MEFDDPKKAITCCCCLTAVIAVAALAFFSYSSLDATEYGLDYSSITKTIDTKYYGSGYHMLGFGHSFIRYPSTVQNMEFSQESNADRPPIQSRTEDGLLIQFRASFQYKLLPDKLYNLYMKYGEDYKGPCMKYAIETLNDAATKYDANEFFNSSQIITQKMMNDLNTTLDTKCYASIQFFQLQNIDIPDKYQDAIQQTLMQDSEISRTENQRKQLQVDLQAMQNSAVISKNKTFNYAQAQANAQETKNDADMQSFYQVVTQQATSYAVLKDTLAMTGDQFIKYIKSQTINEYNQANMVVNIPSRV